MKFIPSIKWLWLRRTVMVVASPYIVCAYVTIAFKQMVAEWRGCWNYVHP